MLRCCCFEHGSCLFFMPPPNVMWSKAQCFCTVCSCVCSSMYAFQNIVNISWKVCDRLIFTKLTPISTLQLWRSEVQGHGGFTYARAPSCPEIVLKSAIVVKFYSFGQKVLIWTFVMLLLHFVTSHDYVYVADVECQVMFSLVTLYCSMCNIALVTF